MSAVIEKCLEKAVKHSAVDQDALEREALDLRDRKSKLLGIEIRAAKEIDRRLEQLSTLHAQQETAAKVGYAPKIDPIVFTWRHRSPIRHRRCDIPAPSLALFGLDKPTASLAYGSGGKRESTPEIPTFVSSRYSDVFEAMASTCTKRRLSRIEMTTVFDGVIPDSTRAKIKEAVGSGTYEKVYLLGEAPEWTTISQEIPRPRVIDPIVVGLQAKALWVIDVFDPTPVETYVATEFTT